MKSALMEGPISCTFYFTEKAFKYGFRAFDEMEIYHEDLKNR